MTIDDFRTALSAVIAPATISGVRGDEKGLQFSLSDGRTVTAKRQRIKAADQAELESYAAELAA